jgi:hypothetical protein
MRGKLDALLSLTEDTAPPRRNLLRTLARKHRDAAIRQLPESAGDCGTQWTAQDRYHYRDACGRQRYQRHQSA